MVNCKRILTIILCMIVLTCLFSMSAYAVEESNVTITQYRYRYKTYKYTKSPIDNPASWILESMETRYDTDNYLTNYVSLNKANEWERNHLSDLILEKSKVWEYYNADSPRKTIYLNYLDNPVYIGSVKYLYSGSSFYQYKYAVKAVFYKYYQWGAWSEWSETEAIPSESMEVETRQVCTVSFDANGGEGAPSSCTYTNDKDIVLSSDIPIRENYIFLGWSLVPNGEVTYLPGDTYSAGCSTTLYAVWECIHVGTVESWSIQIESDIKVVFRIRINNSSLSSAKIKVTVGEQVVTYYPSNMEQDISGCYLVSVSVPAAQMQEAIVIMGMNGSKIETVSSYTVREYCDIILSDDAYAQYHTLVKKIINYGAMAQMYFDYDVENLANDGITDVASIEVPEMTDDLSVSGNISGVNFYGASLVYRDRIAVRYYFTGDVSGCTFTANGNTYTPISKDDMYYIEIVDILPQNLDQQIKLTVTDAEKNMLAVTYGPMNYIVRMNEKGSDSLKNLLKALYNYHLSAKQLSNTAI